MPKNVQRTVSSKKKVGRSRVARFSERQRAILRLKNRQNYASFFIDHIFTFYVIFIAKYFVAKNVLLKIIFWLPDLTTLARKITIWQPWLKGYRMELPPRWMEEYLHWTPKARPDLHFCLLAYHFVFLREKSIGMDLCVHLPTTPTKTQLLRSYTSTPHK